MTSSFQKDFSGYWNWPRMCRPTELFLCQMLWLQKTLKYGDENLSCNYYYTVGTVVIKEHTEYTITITCISIWTRKIYVQFIFTSLSVEKPRTQNNIWANSKSDSAYSL